MLLFLSLSSCDSNTVAVPQTVRRFHRDVTSRDSGVSDGIYSYTVRFPCDRALAELSSYAHERSLLIHFSRVSIGSARGFRNLIEISRVRSDPRDVGLVIELQRPRGKRDRDLSERRSSLFLS